MRTRKWENWRVRFSQRWIATIRMYKPSRKDWEPWIWRPNLKKKKILTLKKQCIMPLQVSWRQKILTVSENLSWATTDLPFWRPLSVSHSVLNWIKKFCHWFMTSSWMMKAFFWRIQDACASTSQQLTTLTPSYSILWRQTSTNKLKASYESTF